MHHLCALGSLSKLRNRKPIFCEAFLSGVDTAAVNFCGTLWFLLGDLVFICLSSSSEKSRLRFEFLKGISTAEAVFLPFQTGVFCKELYFSFHVLDKLPSFKLTRAFAEELSSGNWSSSAILNEPRRFFKGCPPRCIVGRRLSLRGRFECGARRPRRGAALLPPRRAEAGGALPGPARGRGATEEGRASPLRPRPRPGRQ